MLVCYRLIALLLAVIVAAIVLRSRDTKEQVTGGLVLVILVLRVLGIK
jgi:hypothetical protein